MVKVVTSKVKLDCEELIGEFLTEEHYDELVDYDCDFYAPHPLGLENSEENIIFKLRKNFFSEEEQKKAYEGLHSAAVLTENRGDASGPVETGYRNNCKHVSCYELDVLDALINPKVDLTGKTRLDAVEDYYSDDKLKWREGAGSGYSMSKTRRLVWTHEYTKMYDFPEWVDRVSKLSEEEARSEAIELKKEVRKTSYAAQVRSGIIGYFDRYPRIPYGRPTAYTEQNSDKVKMSYPFLQKLAVGFSELLPERFAKQKRCSDSLDERFVLPETPFTTVTVNKTFRTAAHRDAGDLNEGFSNLSVITNGKSFTGGYLVLPEYRVAIDIRPGDLLLINNHEGIHGNTPIELEEDGDRVSLVCYFREGMLELGSWEYEQTRKQFVKDRINDKSHPEQRENWNGTTEGMWKSEEWFDYLEKNGGAEMREQYHPKSVEASSLESFFG